MTTYISWPRLMCKCFEIQKIYSKRSSSLCTNAHHDVTISELDGLAENIKNLISQKRNMNFV